MTDKTLKKAKRKHRAEIARRAVEAHEATQAARAAKSTLKEAYAAFKTRMGGRRIEAGSLEWKQMMVETKAQFDAQEDAKRIAGNAQRRLETYISRHAGSTA